MNEEKLVYAEKSGRPSILKLLIWMFAGEFLACILYAVAQGGNDRFDAQMEGAPLFLTVSLTVDVLLGVLFYRMNGKRKTEIAIYEHTVRFSAPKVPILDREAESGVSKHKIRPGAAVDRTGDRKIGKVTSDTPNSRVECPVSDLRSASRKGKNVLLIMENGDRYLFVRMYGAERLVKVIEDKVAAEVRIGGPEFF